MHLRRTRTILFVAVAIATILTLSFSSRSDTGWRIAASVATANGQPFDGEFVVWMWPDEETERQLPDGASFDLEEVARGRVLGGELRTTLRGMPHGLRDLTIDVWNEQEAATHAVSVSSGPDGLQAPTDHVPDHAPRPPEDSPTPRGVRHQQIQTRARPADSPVAGGVVLAAGVDLVAGGRDRSLAAGGSGTLLSSHDVWTRVGEVFVRDGVSGSAKFSSGYAHSVGYAVKGGVHGSRYREVGTTSFTSTVTVASSMSTRARTHHMLVRYGKYRRATPYGWIYEVKERYALGTGIYRYRTNASFINNCYTQRDTWERDSSSGRDYSISYGVDIDDVVGFDMSERRAWNSGNYVTFRKGTEFYEVCGSNDRPATASRVSARDS